MPVFETSKLVKFYICDLRAKLKNETEKPSIRIYTTILMNKRKIHDFDYLNELEYDFELFVGI